MRYILENETLKIEIDSFGGELKSVINKASGQEYMWCGDGKYWGRTAPVLFPFVGGLCNNTYRFEGKEYSMKSHGFARDNEFTFISQTQDEIWFRLCDSDVTYENYPFHFNLELGYTLRDNSLLIKWRVTNPGQDREDQTLYFSIGGHPAFNCPIHGEDNKAGYKLYFEGLNQVHHHGNLNGTCTREDIVLELTDSRATITPEFFDRTTYMVENKQTGLVAIEDPSGRRYITVAFDTPLFAIWSPEKKNAPFICIEPWYGRADWDDSTEDLPDREYENAISPEETFENTYTVTFS